MECVCVCVVNSSLLATFGHYMRIKWKFLLRNRCFMIAVDTSAAAENILQTRHGEPKLVGKRRTHAQWVKHRRRERESETNRHSSNNVALLCTFVTIKITPQSTYAPISLNENGKVAWLVSVDAFNACGGSPSQMTSEKKIHTHTSDWLGKFFARLFVICLGCWSRHTAQSDHLSWKFYYTPMRINGTFGHFWHTHTQRRRDAEK